jgi:hypothetical protein
MLYPASHHASQIALGIISQSTGASACSLRTKFVLCHGGPTVAQLACNGQAVLSGLESSLIGPTEYQPGGARILS